MVDPMGVMPVYACLCHTTYFTSELCGDPRDSRRNTTPIFTRSRDCFSSSFRGSPDRIIRKQENDKAITLDTLVHRELLVVSFCSASRVLIDLTRGFTVARLITWSGQVSPIHATESNSVIRVVPSFLRRCPHYRHILPFALLLPL